MRRKVFMVVVCALAATAGEGFASLLNLGPEQIVQAGGSALDVGTYSVPSYVDWDNDGLKDLVVGEGSSTAKIRVYLNVGTQSNPEFSAFSYAKSDGGDLTSPGGGCMGCFPRVVHWDGDGRKDLLVGRSNGTIKVYLNIGTDAAPTFDAGTFLQKGSPGSKLNIDVGSRACSTVLDWNNDGAKDLAIGAYDGKIHIFLNEGTDTSPDFLVETFAQVDSSPLVVPSARSSPVILDLDGDSKKDLLTGNTNGQLLLYSNVGTDSDPLFSGYWAVESEGVPIDLPDIPRSRPFVCDWTGDGYLDVLIGAADGQVHLYQGVPEPGTILLLGLGSLALLRKRKL